MQSPRLLALVIVALAAVAGVAWAVSSRWKWFAGLFIAYVIATFAPIDIRPQHWVGVPRVVPVVMGLPTQGLNEAAERGEVWLGGCVVFGNDPKWVVVW
jgi:hypothetical protein